MASKLTESAKIKKELLIKSHTCAYKTTFCFVFVQILGKCKFAPKKWRSVVNKRIGRLRSTDWHANKRETRVRRCIQQPPHNFQRDRFYWQTAMNRNVTYSGSSIFGLHDPGNQQFTNGFIKQTGYLLCCIPPFISGNVLAGKIRSS